MRKLFVALILMLTPHAANASGIHTLYWEAYEPTVADADESCERCQKTASWTSLWERTLESNDRALAISDSNPDNRDQDQ